MQKQLNSLEKLHILLQPYIHKKEIKAVLQCTAKKADIIYEEIFLLMKKNGYRILDYKSVPTKLFMSYCNMDIDEFVRCADIEIKLNKTE